MNPVATYGLIGINILVFIAESMRGGSTNTKVALKFGAQYTPYLEQVFRDSDISVPVSVFGTCRKYPDLCHGKKDR